MGKNLILRGIRPGSKPVATNGRPNQLDGVGVGEHVAVGQK